jgi:hypothetical protein
VFPPVASLSGFVLTFFRVLGATVSAAPKDTSDASNAAVLLGLEGSVNDLDDPDGDTPGEQIPAVEAYGALGIVARPRQPEKIGGRDYAAEGYGGRTPNGMVPFAYRDLRLNRRFPNPKPGSIALVGYGGGFLSFDDADGDTSLGTLYVPYARNGSGAVSKAHMISIGKDGNGTPFVGIISGEGPRVTLLGNQVVVASKDGSNRLEVTDDGVNAVGPFKAASGADLGGPTSREVVMFLELSNYVTQVNTLLSAMAAQLMAPGPVVGAAGAYTASLAAITAMTAALSSTGKSIFTKVA